MNTPPEHSLDAEIRFVCGLIERCAEQALAQQGDAATAVERKAGSREPVTPADRILNEHIARSLRERFADDAIVAEETAQHQPWWDFHRCWFVDPIDGTRAYARGRADWTVQIGLCVEGRPVLGVVAEPSKRRMTWATMVPAPQAFVRAEGCEPAALALTARTWNQMRFIGGRRHLLSRQHLVARRLGIGRWRVRSAGSVGVRMSAIARGEAEIYVQAPGRPKLWDTCAPEVLVTAAGGRVSDWHGRPLDYRQRTTTHPAGLIVCHPRHHAEILRRLEPLTERWLG